MDINWIGDEDRKREVMGSKPSSTKLRINIVY